MFSHKFKPQEIVLHTGTKSFDPDIAYEIDSLMIRRRSSESEVLIDSYKKNTVTICGNVKKFNLLRRTIKLVYSSLMDILDIGSQEKLKKLFHRKNLFQFACTRKLVKLESTD